MLKYFCTTEALCQNALQTELSKSTKDNIKFILDRLKEIIDFLDPQTRRTKKIEELIKTAKANGVSEMDIVIKGEDEVKVKAMIPQYGNGSFKTSSDGTITIHIKFK